MTTTSAKFGGAGGNEFTKFSGKINTLELFDGGNNGHYLEAVVINGTRYGSGGGRSAGKLDLTNDRIVSITVKSAQYVDHIKFTTASGKSIEGGGSGGTATTLNFYELVGVGGRSGDWLDAIQFEYKEHCDQVGGFPQFETGTWGSTTKYAWNATRSGFSQFETDIHFSRPFLTTPVVTVALSELDINKDHNLRVNAVADKITTTGFVLQIKWWSDTHIYSAGATWFAVGTASGSLHFEGDHYIKSKKSGKSLDVFEGKHDNSTPLIIYDFHGKDNQVFSFKYESDGTYTITAKHSGKVLDISGGSTADCAQLIQYDHHGGPNQRFTLTRNNDDGSYVITAKHSGKVLDVTGGSDDNCTKVIQYTKHDGPNQRWFITRK